MLADTVMLADPDGEPETFSVVETVGENETVSVCVWVQVRNRVAVEVAEAKPEPDWLFDIVREGGAVLVAVAEIVPVLEELVLPVDVRVITTVRV